MHISTPILCLALAGSTLAAPSAAKPKPPKHNGQLWPGSCQKYGTFNGFNDFPPSSHSQQLPMNYHWINWGTQFAHVTTGPQETYASDMNSDFINVTDIVRTGSGAILYQVDMSYDTDFATFDAYSNTVPCRKRLFDMNSVWVRDAYTNGAFTSNWVCQDDDGHHFRYSQAIPGGGYTKITFPATFKKLWRCEISSQPNVPVAIDDWSYKMCDYMSCA